MNKIYRKTAAALCLAALLIWACGGSVLGAPAKIIFDTDMAEDVDDVGALALLHALADAGEAEILACMIS
ncbi:MAG: nucleoside hydrolase, partial [Verrucomicrobia bacterium]|nr:nucleoside hydrolase [Verrucomicrobiota bacterium]